MYNGVDSIGGQTRIDESGEFIYSEAQPIGERGADNIESQPEHEAHHADEHRDGGIFAGQDAVELHAAAVFLALMAFDDRAFDNFFYKIIAHFGERGVSVKPGIVLHLNYAVVEQIALVAVEFELVRHIVAALNELCRAEAARQTETRGVVLDKMHYSVDAAVDGRSVGAEVPYFRQGFAFCDLQSLIDKFGHALALCRAYRHNGNTECVAHLLDIYCAAVRAHLVHHVEREHHRHAQLEQLQRQIKVSLYIRGIDYIYDTVGLLVDYKVARDYFLLRIWTQRVYAGQVDDGAVFCAFYRAHLLIDRDSGEVADMLIRACQSIEERCFSAVLITDESEYHFASSPVLTSIFFASSTRSVSS